MVLVGLSTIALASGGEDHRPDDEVTSEERHLAINDADRFAWMLFSRINRPANPAEPDGPVLWETWANARDVFADPNEPPTWEEEVAAKRSLDDLDPRPLQQVVADRLQESGGPGERGANVQPQFDPQVIDRQGNETRLNRETFDFIVDNDLYFIEGQEAFFQQGRAVIFPLDAKEIKAQWRRLGDVSDIDEFRKEYHTAIFKRGEVEEVWGLTALHITTKDLPNWFWATFEHKDNLGIEAVVPSRDSFGRADDGSHTERLTALLEEAGLDTRRWDNYRLRGTQIDFTDPIGRPTILANSQIEEGFQETSSCITCHARASIGPKPRQEFPRPGEEPRQSPHDVARLPVFESDDPLRGSIGTPDPDWFAEDRTNPPAHKFTQLDFVWSMFRARRRDPFTQQAPGRGGPSRQREGDGGQGPGDHR
jgi:hypothetical protein